jgi:hypothetical protein
MQFECRLLSLFVNFVILLCFSRPGHDISRYFLASHWLFTVFFKCPYSILIKKYQTAAASFNNVRISQQYEHTICYSRVEMFVRLCSVSVELWSLVGPWCIPGMTDSIYWAVVEWKGKAGQHARPHTKWWSVRCLMTRNRVFDAHVALGRRFIKFLAFYRSQVFIAVFA